LLPRPLALVFNDICRGSRPGRKYASESDRDLISRSRMRLVTRDTELSVQDVLVCSSFAFHNSLLPKVSAVLKLKSFYVIGGLSWRCGMPDKTVLIVDDDESMVRALSIRLRDSGYKVLAACDGMQAFAQAQRHQPDLILLDIRMPAGGGFGALERLNHSIRTMCIPVIIITALEEEGLREKAESFGANDFFKKPFDNGELLEAVNRGVAMLRSPARVA
jgi:CheY-like chemotaxis protein